MTHTKSLLVLLSIIIPLLSPSHAAEKQLPPQKESIPETIPIRDYDLAGAEKPGWKLCAQGVSFKASGYDFVQTLQLMQKIGIPYLEHCNSHQMGGEHDWNVVYTMSAEHREIAKAALKKYGIKMINYGVVNHKYTREQWRQVFAFAKEMGVETVMAEPAYLDLTYVDGLAQEYGVRMAIHNHPKPTLYWDPEIVRKHLPKLSSQTGIGPDVGNWHRSGVTAIEKLPSFEGRLYAIQIKDFIGQRQVTWGAGSCHFTEILHELKRQDYQGTITIEYFNQQGDLPGDIQECVRNFKRICYWLARE